jgi:hypothetical protein
MIIWPEYITIKDWADNLHQDYPNEFLPVLEEEDNWPEWGTLVAGTGVFSEQNIPTPSTPRDTDLEDKKTSFNSWEEWAKTVYNIMIDSQG